MEIRAASYMRLLNTKTLRLEQFFEGQIPGYAIFSHLWTEEEVLFPSMEFLDGKAGMKGFHKIVNLCRIAAADGHRYVWMDTACINRGDQVELSEAVNSMFGYYEKAEICYAYLEDVDNRNSLAESRWFTRGWTLPELIAPKILEFLDSGWTRLGTRESLASQIATITSIPTPVLRGRSIRNYNAACRMSWAAGRSTSTESDGAYCLLGLFNIKTSLDSTEGVEAFRRLQQLILEQHEDYTLLAWDRVDPSRSKMERLLAPSAEFFNAAHNPWSYCDMQPSLTRNGKLSHLASRFIKGTPGGRPQVTPYGIVLTVPIRQVGLGSYQACLTTCSKPEYNFVCISLGKLSNEEYHRRFKAISSRKSEKNEYYRTGNIELVPMVYPSTGLQFEYEKILIRWFEHGEKGTDYTLSELPRPVFKLRGNEDNIVATSEKVGVGIKAARKSDDEHQEEGSATEEFQTRHTLRREAIYDSLIITEKMLTENSGYQIETPHAPDISNDQEDFERDSKRHIPTLHSTATGHSPTVSIKSNIEYVQHVPADSGYGQSNQPHNQSQSHGAPDEDSILRCAIEDSDVRTEFSGTDMGDQEYVSELAEAIFHAVELSQFDASKMVQISKLLPGLLRAFSLKLGSKPSDSMQAEAAYWVRKYRQRICGFFEDNLPLQAPVPSDPVNKEIVLSRYLAQPDDAEQISLPEPIIETEAEGNFTYDFKDAHDTGGSDGSEDEDSPHRDLYRNAILKSWAYRWLMASLQRESTMKRPAPDLLGEFETTILSALPDSYHQLSRRAPSKSFTVVFELDWAPIRFLQEQTCTDHGDVADLGTIITLTGEIDDAQATTASSYMSQTWPVTGPCTLQLVVDTIQDVIFHQRTVSFQDGTTLEAYIDEDRFIVTCTGTGDSIAEVGGQLGWMGAALRSSQIDAGISSCSPCLQRIMASVSSSIAQTTLTESSSDITFQFHFGNIASHSDSTLNGDCWHRMFRNPVLVTGYPILTKSAGLGLELPLDMMAELAGADRAVEFDGKVFVKGFSTMLIATKHVQDLLVWHYHYKSRGARISYLDHNITTSDGINLFQLQNARHVVGWCASSNYYAGAQDAHYQSIKRTGLDPPGPGCILEKITLSGGKYITAGGTIALSVKDIAPHVTRECYVDQLNWIREQYVVFWDDDDHEKRGWLVNGSSALLHLVRASLHRYRTGRSSRHCLFNPSEMDNETEHTVDSAHNVLLNVSNRTLKVWPGKYEIYDETEAKWSANDYAVSKSSKRKKAYVLFQDLVEKQYRTLEIMMEYQKHKAGQNGVKLELRARKHLEGWDFVDLISDRDLHPRVATLQRAGYGWVDLIQSINATSILGCGFGDLIKPAGSPELCPDWQTLPKGQYYLAAHISDLRDIFDEFGSGRDDPPFRRPIHRLNWHCAGDAPTSSCQQCQLQRHTRRRKGKEIKHTHDPVQTFYPDWSKLLTCKEIRSPDDLGPEYDNGVVIFGHNFKWPFYWGEMGRTELAEDPNPQNAGILKTPGRRLVSLSRTLSNLSIFGQSSRSSEGTGGAMMGSSSISAGSAYSTPQESVQSEGRGSSTFRSRRTPTLWSREPSTARSGEPATLRTEGTRRLKPTVAKSGDGEGGKRRR